MKNIIFIFLFSSISLTFSNDTLLLDAIITDPSISLKCKEMFKDREDKINIKNRIRSLIERGEKSLKYANKRISAKTQLELSIFQLKQEQELNNLKISNLEEEIIRKGCPGITL